MKNKGCTCETPLPNGTKEDYNLEGILHEVNGYWVSNEGSKKEPLYHVWIPKITHCEADSAYNDLSLAVARCNFLAKYHGVKTIKH